MEGVHEPDGSRRDDAPMPAPTTEDGPDTLAHSTPVVGRARVPVPPPEPDAVPHWSAVDEPAEIAAQTPAAAVDDPAGAGAAPPPATVANDDPADWGIAPQPPTAAVDDPADRDAAPRPPVVGRARVAAPTPETAAGRGPAHQHIPVPRAAGPGGGSESWFTPQRREEVEPVVEPARGADELPRRNSSGLPDYSAMPWLKLAERGHSPWSAFGSSQEAASQVAELTVSTTPGPDTAPERPGTVWPAEPPDRVPLAAAVVGLAGSVPPGQEPPQFGGEDAPPPARIRAVARVPVPQPRTAPPPEDSPDDSSPVEAPVAEAAHHDATATRPAPDPLDTDQAPGWGLESDEPSGRPGLMERFRETNTDDWYPNWRYRQATEPATAPAGPVTSTPPAEPDEVRPPWAASGASDPTDRWKPAAPEPWAPTVTGSTRAWTPTSSTPAGDPAPAAGEVPGGPPWAPATGRDTPAEPGERGAGKPWMPAPASDPDDEQRSTPATAITQTWAPTFTTHPDDRHPTPPATGTQRAWTPAVAPGQDDLRPPGLATGTERAWAPITAPDQGGSRLEPAATGTERAWAPTVAPDQDDARFPGLSTGTERAWAPAPDRDRWGRAAATPVADTEPPWRSALHVSPADRRQPWEPVGDPYQRTPAPEAEDLDRPFVVPRAVGPATEGEEQLNLPQMGTRALAEARLAAIDQSEAEAADPDSVEPEPTAPPQRARTGILGLVDDLPSPDIGPDLDLSTITGRQERITDSVPPAPAAPEPPDARVDAFGPLPQRQAGPVTGSPSIAAASIAAPWIGGDAGVDDGTVTVALPTPAARPPAERDVRYDTIDWRKHIRGSVARESSTLYRDQQPPRPATTPIPATAPPASKPAGKPASKADDEDDEKLSLADRIGRIVLLVGGIVLFIVLFLYGPQISRWWNS